MREILFKAKRIDNDEWVDGGYSYCEKDDTHYITIMGKDHISHIGFHQHVDPNTICQYTGLTDKNGNKIWENDIIREYEDTYMVFWDNCNSEYGVKNDIESMGLACVCTNESEVIGNIFNNADLVKE